MALNDFVRPVTITVLATLLSLPTQAALIPVLNSSFEIDDAGSGFITQTPTHWTSLGGEAFIENTASVSMSGGDGAQYLGLRLGGFLYQDLGVAFQANKQYSVDLVGAHRAGFNHGILEFGLFSSDAIGSTLGTAGFMDLQGIWSGTGNPDADNIFDVFRTVDQLDAVGSGSLAEPYLFTTGSSAPTGNMVVFLRQLGGERVNLDAIQVREIPEPGSLALLGFGALILAGFERKKSS